MRYATVEVNLHECRQQYDELTKHLDCAKKEVERLLKEIDVFQSEKDTADARISILEQNLQKALLDTERVKNAENQKISELRAQLSEEVSDKIKQIKAHEDALQEIQRLKETMKTERKNEDDVISREDTGIFYVYKFPLYYSNRIILYINESCFNSQNKIGHLYCRFDRRHTGKYIESKLCRCLFGRI